MNFGPKSRHYGVVNDKRDQLTASTSTCRYMQISSSIQRIQAVNFLANDASYVEYLLFNTCFLLFDCTLAPPAVPSRVCCILSLS